MHSQVIHPAADTLM